MSKEYQDGEAKYPLYEAMLANMDKYLVDRLLLPTHGTEHKKTTTRKGGKSSSTSSSSSSTSTKKKQKRRRTTTKRTTYAPTKGSWWKGKGKGKGKEKEPTTVKDMEKVKDGESPRKGKRDGGNAEEPPSQKSSKD